MAQKGATQKPIDITLDVQLSAASARALKDRLLYGMKQGSKVRLQGSHVERMEAACAQVLAAFFRDAQQKQFPVAWLSVSPALERALTRTGLAHILQAKE